MAAYVREIKYSVHLTSPSQKISDVTCLETICVFRNERRNTRSNEFFEQTACETGTIPTWCEVLLRLINTADERVESYKSLYRTRLAKLQFRIHTYNPLDYALVKDLSGFVAEITIFLDPLHAQITIIRNWQQLYFEDDSQIPHITHLFQEAISTRETRLSQLKKLQERAKESQNLVSQS